MDTVSICNILCYEKWKVFGKSCRIFGVMHFGKNEEYLENSLPGSLNFIDYIEEKLGENKRYPGIIDIYSENHFSINEDVEPGKYVGETYDDIKHDALISMHNNFMGCFYEKHNSEDYPINCVFAKKYNNELNARFHFIDIRERFFLSKNNPVLILEKEYVEKKRNINNFKIIFEKFEIYLKALYSRH